MADATSVEKHQDKVVPPPGPRTAVLVFHGIGDQRPMETMLGVVNAVLGEPEEPGAIGRWIKPYVGKDGFFDLKSVSTKAVGDEGRRYDFFELYWADQMSGTRLVAVLLWLCDLAKRDRKSLPADAVWIWYAVVGLMAGAMMAAVHLAWVIGLTLTGTTPEALQLRAIDAAAQVAAAFLAMGLGAAVVVGFCLAKGLRAALAVLAVFAVLAFVGCLSCYVVAVRFMQGAGIQGVALQSALWFVVTGIGVAIMDASIMQWSRTQQVVGVLVAVGLCWLIASTTAAEG